MPGGTVFLGKTAGGGIGGEAAVAVVEPDGDRTIGDGLAQDEVEIGVLIEVDGEQDGGLRDGEAGDVGTLIAVEVGGGPDGLGQVSQAGGGGEDEKEERLHLNIF